MALWWCPMETDPRPDSHPALDRLLRSRVLVCDGAMGTMLHSAGVPLDRSLSGLNLARPDLVRDMHAAYLAAGADIVQTNTFDANRPRLARAGLQDSVAEINIAGARVAREAVRESGSPALVAGSVGPVMSAAAPRIPHQDREPILREQIAILASWVDLIILETFGDTESLAQAASVALAECDLPMIAQLTFGDDGRTLGGEEPRVAAAALADAQPLRVAVARLSAPAMSPPGQPEEHDRAGELLARLAGSIEGGAAIRGPELVMFLPEQEDAAPPAGNTGAGAGSPGARAQLLLRQAGAARLTCGLSELTRLPEMAPQALRQAQHAIDLGIRLGRAGQAICYEELGIYRLLLQVGDMHQLWQFA